MSEYDNVSRGSLKLKGDHGVKKKKGKKKEKIEARVFDTPTQDVAIVKIDKTKAERSFQKMQEKRQIARIMEKASKSHKQRVEDFNRHLDSLTEHYDIPKVSWTK